MVGDGSTSIAVVLAELSTEVWLALLDEGAGVSDKIGITKLVCVCSALICDMEKSVEGKEVKLV